MKNLTYLFLIFIFSCAAETNESKEKEVSEPSFCDCVNHDYHREGDKEKCDKIEKEIEEKLKNATHEEKGEILIQIKDCKVQGQYDND